jgi:GTP-binding protein
MFRDECEIEVRGGKGGDGVSSFRREKYVQHGGPDGGDGGDGGGVILRAAAGLNSLLRVGRMPQYRASGGRPGGPRNRTGARGEDLVLEVPVGTQIHDAERGHLLRDLVDDGDTCLVAAGGRGGRGNASFASAVQQTPTRADRGTPGEERRLRLELKLIAQVGLVGLPNAGKSTFLAAVSQARPKIAGYPFTTLVPQMGIATLDEDRTLVLADLPGLIEGAAEGAGLGHRFLKHVERCQVLLHLVDVSEEALEPPARALEVIEEALERYSVDLAGRPRLVLATKCESPAAEARADELAAVAGRPVRCISSATGRGLREVLTEAQGLVLGASGS